MAINQELEDRYLLHLEPNSSYICVSFFCFMFNLRVSKVFQLNSRVLSAVLILFVVCPCLFGPDSVLADNSLNPAQNEDSNGEKAFEYLKGLKGKWTVDGGKEGVFGWEFDVTSRGSIVIERLKVGTPAEMLTIYHLDDGKLIANHFCQLKNRPRLLNVDITDAGDIDFDCAGDVGGALSHDDLHMHGVHFKKDGKAVVVWMDMHKDGKLAFETRYVLKRIEVTKSDSTKARK